MSYYPACNQNQQSLVEGLKSINEDSSFNNREKIAKLNGISNYEGTGEQNIELLNKLKQGKLLKSGGASSSDTIPYEQKLKKI